LKNDTLRNYLISWNDNLEDYKEEENRASQFWINQIEPYIIDNGDFTNFANPTNFDLLLSQKFRNLTERRAFLLKNILNEINDGRIEKNIREILRLSKKQ